jgi:hypothetical protein
MTKPIMALNKTWGWNKDKLIFKGKLEQSRIKNTKKSKLAIKYKH